MGDPGEGEPRRFHRVQVDPPIDPTPRIGQAGGGLLARLPGQSLRRRIPRPG